MLNQNLREIGFEFVQELGRGAFSRVLQAREKTTGQQFALKQISKAEFGKNYLNTSMQSKTELNLTHKHIIVHYTTFQTIEHFYIKMELARGGTLFQLIKARGVAGFTEQEVAQVADAILQGVIYLHRQNIIHRDLKPENILLLEKDDLSTIKISDFGLSTFRYDRLQLRKRKGTPLYMAPEMMETMSGPYDKSVDVWSIGLVLFQMLCKGRHAISAKNPAQLCQKLTSFKYKAQQDISSQANSFLSLMLKAKPSERPQPYQVFTHVFMAKASGRIALSYSQSLSCYQDQQVIMMVLRGLIFVRKISQENESSLTGKGLPPFQPKSSFVIRRKLSPNQLLLKSLQKPPMKDYQKKVQFEKICPARKTAEQLIKLIMSGPKKQFQCSQINKSAITAYTHQPHDFCKTQHSSEQSEPLIRIRTINSTNMKQLAMINSRSNKKIKSVNRRASKQVKSRDARPHK